jgi:hypothetical protein
MKKAFALVTVILLGLAAAVYAQDQPAPKEKPAKKADTRSTPRIEGTVQTINKDTSTLVVRTRRQVPRNVVYTPDTKYTKLNKPGGSLDEIKEGTRIIALGKWQGTNLVAERIDIRLPK